MAVEALIRKHESFEKTFEAQGSKINELEDFGNKLIADNHYDSDGIKLKLRAVISRRDKLKESTEQRKKKLDKSKSLQQFLRNVYEVNKILFHNSKFLFYFL